MEVQMGFNWAAIAAICSLLGALVTIASIAFVAGRLREKQEEHGERIGEHAELLKSHASTLTDHEVQLGRLNEWKDGYNAAARVTGQPQVH
jgi:hypothetical protein